MAVQRQLPGGAFLNETDTKQRQTPGGAFANETVAATTSDAVFAITTADATASGGATVSAAAVFTISTAAAAFSGAASAGDAVAIFAATTADSTFSGGATVAAAAVFALTTDDSTLAANATGDVSGGWLVTPVLKNNTGTVLANESAATAYVYHLTTGALIVKKTGQTTNASGVMTIIDAALTISTEYRVVLVLNSGAEGLDKITAT